VVGLLLYAEAIHSMPQPSQHHLRQGGAVCKTKQKPDGTGGHDDAVGGLRISNLGVPSRLNHNKKPA